MSVQSAHRRVPSTVLFVVMFLVLSVTALYAATPTDPAGPVSDDQPVVTQPTVTATGADAVTAEASEQRPSAQPIVRTPMFAAHRPVALVPLYASFVALQAFDARSTMTALGRGAVEANPLLGGVASHGGALLALKMGAAAGTIFVSEKLWKRNPVAAVALMVGLNSAYAIIVAHNYQVARAMR